LLDVLGRILYSTNFILSTLIVFYMSDCKNIFYFS
jgi:hypothetical protein